MEDEDGVTVSERPGEVFTGAFIAGGDFVCKEHIGLLLAPKLLVARSVQLADPENGITFNEPLQADWWIKAFAWGWKMALPLETVHSLLYSCIQAKATHPDANVVDVRVVLSDENHDFTWAEFCEWLDSP